MSYYITKRERQFTEAGACTACGVQATTRNTAGECNACHNAGYERRRAARKRELAAMPRCEFCTRRATLIACGAVNLCGRHYKIASARLAMAQGGLGLFYTATAADVRSLLREVVAA